MPKGKSSLFAKIENKLKSAVKKHAGDETNYGRIQIPAGIQNGVAKLTKCYFDKYKTGDYTGEPFFRCEAVVVKPTMLGDLKVAGLTTSIMPIPVCDTKNGKGEVVGVSDHVKDILNEMRKLGADTTGIEDADDMGAALEALAETIQEEGPHFRFSTSRKDGRVDPKTKVKRPDGVWENWNGTKGLENFDPDAEAEDDVQEEEAEEPVDVEEEEAPKTKGSGKKAPPPDDDETTEASDETDPLDTLALSADDDDDKAAQKELTKIAKQNGLTVKEIEEDANSWTHLVEMIKAKIAGGDGEESEAEAEEEEEEKKPYVPSKEDIVMYKGPKDKKPMEYEVIAVYKKTSKVDLLNNNDRKTTIKSVPFDQISES